MFLRQPVLAGVYSGPGCCMTQDSGGSILDDERRLSVALSRARHKLVLVGSSAAVAGHPPFARLLALLGPNRLIRLRSGDDMGLEGLL